MILSLAVNYMVGIAIDRFNKRKLYKVSFLISGFINLALGGLYFFYLKDNVVSSYLLVIGKLVLLCNGGFFYSVNYTYIQDHYKQDEYNLVNTLNQLFSEVASIVCGMALAIFLSGEKVYDFLGYKIHKSEYLEPLDGRTFIPFILVGISAIYILMYFLSAFMHIDNSHIENKKRSKEHATFGKYVKVIKESFDSDPNTMIYIYLAEFAIILYSVHLSSLYPRYLKEYFPESIVLYEYSWSLISLGEICMLVLLLFFRKFILRKVAFVMVITITLGLMLFSFDIGEFYLFFMTFMLGFQFVYVMVAKDQVIISSIPKKNLGRVHSIFRNQAVFFKVLLFWIFATDLFAGDYRLAYLVLGIFVLMNVMGAYAFKKFKSSQLGVRA
ncbi:hypothetical protein HNQ88_001673 [Aureibacter tunicatorum]|uniref:MFS transporter n=2 Tax=Aureibacter tunicatorum TaxID=866807 RepID=A0AAE3XMS4_9BACT|nr:hypothetical protein [Aureibacter tunicatorum]